MRRRSRLFPPRPSKLQPSQQKRRRKVAAGEPERTSYGCGDIETDTIAMDETLFGRHTFQRGLGSGGEPRQWTTSVLGRTWRRADDAESP